MKLFVFLFPAIILLVACQPMTAATLIAEQDVEFVLAPAGRQRSKIQI